MLKAKEYAVAQATTFMSWWPALEDQTVECYVLTKKHPEKCSDMPLQEQEEVLYLYNMLWQHKREKKSLGLVTMTIQILSVWLM